MSEIMTFINFEDKQLDIKTISDLDKSWEPNSNKQENDLISHILRRDHSWEPYQTEITIELLKKLSNKKFIDIGAHIGYYSLIAASYGWFVESYESNSLYYKIFDDNIICNNFTELIKSYNIRVDEKISHDNISNQKNIGIIKIDVEGAEPEIIQGLTKSLKNQDIDALIIEISPKFRNVEILIQLIQNIHSYGYNYYDLGLSPQRQMNTNTNHLENLSMFDINDLHSIDQTNLLFIKKNLLENE